jgi:hypothetical protein
MKKNILTAILALILSVYLFFTFSIKNTIATDNVINSTILEISIPSERVIKNIIPLVEITTEETTTEVSYEMENTYEII